MSAVPQKILMCAPDHFGVDYIINPWMEGQRGTTNPTKAARQWQNLRVNLSDKTELVFVTPQKGLPDLVFTANAGLVLDNKVVVSRFKSPERQGEEPHFRDWFTTNGFTVLDWPSDVAFEGAGDALLDRGQSVLWVAYGVRSDAAAPELLGKLYDYRTLGLRLVDPRFYHLDTCFCPLAGGYVMYFPQAFDAASQDLIAANIAPEKRIVIEEVDALNFSCNAVDIDGHVIMNNASTMLQDKLRLLGFTPVIIPLTEFMKAGGAAKCLTLKLAEPR